jgi:hypothetical protein
MSRPDAPNVDPSSSDGSRTSASGTPFAVPASRDRQALATATSLLAGPVIWSVHFMLVYLVAEGGCTGDGPGLRLFDPPVPKVVTLAATAVAAFASLACAAWAYRRWRAVRHEQEAGEAADRPSDLDERDSGGSLAFAGFLLSLLSFVMVLFVGLPALVLPSC